MPCQRCQGFTVEERMFDPVDDIQWITVTRCINCGDVRESGGLQASHQEPVRHKGGRQPRHSMAVFLERAS